MEENKSGFLYFIRSFDYSWRNNDEKKYNENNRLIFNGILFILFLFLALAYVISEIVSFAGDRYSTVSLSKEAINNPVTPMSYLDFNIAFTIEADDEFYVLDQYSWAFEYSFNYMMIDGDNYFPFNVPLKNCSTSLFPRMDNWDYQSVDMSRMVCTDFTAFSHNLSLIGEITDKVAQFMTIGFSIKPDALDRMSEIKDLFYSRTLYMQIYFSHAEINTANRTHPLSSKMYSDVIYFNPDLYTFKYMFISGITYKKITGALFQNIELTNYYSYDNQEVNFQHFPDRTKQTTDDALSLVNFFFLASPNHYNIVIQNQDFKDFLINVTGVLLPLFLLVHLLMYIITCIFQKERVDASLQTEKKALKHTEHELNKQNTDSYEPNRQIKEDV